MQKAIRRQWSRSTPRQESLDGPPFSCRFLLWPKAVDMATCAVVTVACSLGEHTNNRVSRNRNKLVLTPEALWWGPARHAGLWSSGECRQRAETTDSSKPSRGGLSCSPWPLQPLRFVLFIGWHMIEKVILSLYKNRVWTSNTGMKNTLYGRSDFIYLEGLRLGSQSLLFPCKKWPQLPRPLCKLVFS